MSENPRQQASEILMKAFAPAPEMAEPEHQETDTPAVETLQTPEVETKEPEMADTPELEPIGDGEQDIATINRLAETLDIDVADMYQLGFNVDGNENPVTLGELKDHWQQTRDIDAARRELETEREQIKQEREKGPELPPQEVVQAQAVLMTIQGEWQALNQSGLRDSDPGQYSAKALEIQNRYQQAQQNASQIGQVIESKQFERLQASQQELHKRIPDLADDKRREVISGRVGKYVEKYGYSVEDLARVEDPRLMHLIIEASALAEQKGTLRNKRVNTAPKVLKSDAVQNSQAGRSAALKRLTEQARNSGQTRDKVSAVSALLQKGK